MQDPVAPQVESLQGKGASFDSIDARRRELEVRATIEAVGRQCRLDLSPAVMILHQAQLLHEREAQVIAVQQAALDAARLDRDAAVAEAKSCSQRIELLAAERSGLSAALEDARAAVKREATERAHTETQLREAQRQRDAYQEQLMRVHAEARAAGDDRISSEVSRLREGSARDLDELRRAAREAYDREVAGLKDSRAAAVAEAQRTQERLDALQVRHFLVCFMRPHMYQRLASRASAAPL